MPLSEIQLKQVMDQFKILRRESHLLSRKGDRAGAIEKAKEAFEYLEQKQDYLGYYLESAIDLAGFYGLAGDWVSAEPIFEKCLQVREAINGRMDKDTVTALMMLGCAKHALHKYTEAEAILRSSVALREELFGPSHPEVSVALSNLAAVYEQTGRTAEGRKLRSRVERIGIPKSFNSGYLEKHKI